MTSVSAGHIILTPTQPVGSGWPQRELNPGPPHQSRALYRLSYRAPKKKREVDKKTGKKNESTNKEIPQRQFQQLSFINEKS